MGVRARALVDNISPRVGGASDINNLSDASRVRFDALGDTMRAVPGICSCARDARVRLRVHSVTRSLNCCTCTIAKRDDVASGASATHKFFCDMAVCSSPKFCWTSAARDATAYQYTRSVVAALLLNAMLLGAASSCC